MAALSLVFSAFAPSVWWGVALAMSASAVFLSWMWLVVLLASFGGA